MLNYNYKCIIGSFDDGEGLGTLAAASSLVVVRIGISGIGTGIGIGDTLKSSLVSANSGQRASRLCYIIRVIYTLWLSGMGRHIYIAT